MTKKEIINEIKDWKNVDKEIRSMIIKIWQLGGRTYASCAGHKLDSSMFLKGLDKNLEDYIYKIGKDWYSCARICILESTFNKKVRELFPKYIHIEVWKNRFRGKAKNGLMISWKRLG